MKYDPWCRHRAQPLLSPRSFCNSQHEIWWGYDAGLQSKPRKHADVIRGFMLRKILPMFIDPTIRQCTIPAIACRHSNWNPRKERRPHQTLERLEKYRGIDGPAKQRHQFAQGFSARDRPDLVEVWMVSQERGCILAGQEGDPRFRQEPAQGGGDRQTQNLIADPVRPN